MYRKLDQEKTITRLEEEINEMEEIETRPRSKLSKTLKNQSTFTSRERKQGKWVFEKV